MSMDQGRNQLRVLVAAEPGEPLSKVAQSIEGLGHIVISETDLDRVTESARVERPDVAVVIVAHGEARALELVEAIVHEATCPVIAVLAEQDEHFVVEAARRGIAAYLTIGDDPQEVQSSIDIVLRRFAEYRDLQGAFERRALTERAKGVLMERNGIDEVAAFELLRQEARRTNRRIVEVAEAVLGSHRLLSRGLGSAAGSSNEPPSE